MRDYIAFTATVVLVLLEVVVIAIGGFRLLLAIFFGILLGRSGDLPIFFAALGVPVIAAIAILYFTFVPMRKRTKLTGGILCSVVLGGYAVGWGGLGTITTDSSLQNAMIGIVVAFWVVYVLRNQQSEQNAAMPTESELAPTDDTTSAKARAHGYHEAESGPRD